MVGSDFVHAEEFRTPPWVGPEHYAHAEAAALDRIGAILARRLLKEGAACVVGITKDEKLAADCETKITRFRIEFRPQIRMDIIKVPGKVNPKVKMRKGVVCSE